MLITMVGVVHNTLPPSWVNFAHRTVQYQVVQPAQTRLARRRVLPRAVNSRPNHRCTMFPAPHFPSHPSQGGRRTKLPTAYSRSRLPGMVTAKSSLRWLCCKERFDYSGEKILPGKKSARIFYPVKNCGRCNDLISYSKVIVTMTLLSAPQRNCTICKPSSPQCCSWRRLRYYLVLL